MKVNREMRALVLRTYLADVRRRFEVKEDEMDRYVSFGEWDSVRQCAHDLETLATLMSTTGKKLAELELK